MLLLSMLMCLLLIVVQAETEAVAQYIENSTEVGELRDQIEECDTVLARMQEMLLGAS